MKQIKKFCLLMLTIVSLLITVMSISQAIDSQFIVRKGVLEAYNGSGGKVVIPDNLGISEIGNNVFKDNSALTSMAIPTGVKTIGEAAFQGCENLVFVTLPTGLTAIGDNAFAGCYYLESITLPSTLLAVGSGAFANCYNIDTIYVPAGVTSIGTETFSKGKFPSIQIHGVAESYAETYAKENNLTFLVTAEPSSSKVVINKTDVSIVAVNIDGHNYFKLRDLAMALSGSEKQFEVDYSFDDLGYGPTNKSVNIATKMSYTPVGGELSPLSTGVESVIVPLASTVQQVTKLFIDGNETAFDFYTINGNNYFKLRDIAKALDFNVAWESTSNTVLMDTASGYN